MINKIENQYKYAFLIIAQIFIISISLIVPIFYKKDFFSIILSCDTFVTAIMIILLLDIKCNVGHIKKIYLALFLIIGLSFIFNGIYYSVIGYIAIGIIFTFVIPLLNLTFARTSIGSMGRALAIGIVITFIAFFILSVCCGPALGRAQYTSFFSNPNTLGGYMIIVVAASIFLIFDTSPYLKKSRAVYLFVFSFAVSVAIYTNSRTSILAILIQIIFVCVVSILWCIYNQEVEKLKEILKKGFLVICLLVFCSLFTFFLLTNVKITLIKHFPAVQVTTEYDEISLQDGLKRTGTRYSKGVSGNNKNDEFTSGRMDIWSTFINNLELKGHQEEGLKVIEKNRFYQKTNAHNVYLQMAYSAGICAGIAMIILMILVAKDLIIKIITFFKTGELENEVIFTVCISLGFAIFSLTSGGYMVFTYLPTTTFYFMLYTVTVNKRIVH